MRKVLAVVVILCSTSCISENGIGDRKKARAQEQTIVSDTFDSFCPETFDTASTTITPPYEDPPLEGHPRIRVFPDAIELGPTDRECEATTKVRVRSVGQKPLVIESIEWTSIGAPDVIASHPPDAILAPGDELVFEYQQIENDGIDDFARLFIRSNAINDPYVVVDQNFRANDYPTQIDTHVGVEKYKADVLFVIDNSCSMGEEQAALSSNAVKFASPLISSDIDFQVGVITTDSASLRGPIITPSTPDIVGELQAQFLAGTSGNPYEIGMEMAFQATGGGPGPFGAFSWDSGVLREDSYLTIVFVTDEPGDDSRTVIEYSDWFQSIYGSDSLAIYSVINADDPEAPDTGRKDLCAALYAPRYVELSMLNPGGPLNICGSWGEGLTMIAESSYVPITEFEMSRSPIEPDQIIVTIDGRVSPPSDWEYDGTAGNKIVFDRASAPTGEDVVQIEYDYLACR